MFAVGIAAAIALLVAAGLLLRPRPDPYLRFAAGQLSGTDAGKTSHLLPIDAPWSLTQDGVGPIRLGAQPADVVRIVGKPSSVATFAGEENDIPFYLMVHHSQFFFARGQLYEVYLQLSDFPNLMFGEKRIASLDRETFKKLGPPVLSEGRQDVKLKLTEETSLAVGFVADGPSPSGRPFYAKLIRAVGNGK